MTNTKSESKNNDLSFENLLRNSTSGAFKRGQMTDLVQVTNDLKNQVKSMPGASSKYSISVNVKNSQMFNRDLRAFNALVNRNNIRQAMNKQKFYIRPGREKRLQRAQKHRRLFKEGFKHLINLVKDARRKGY